MKYISAPFGKIENKEALMDYITNYSATCFLNGQHVICPLTMGYNFGLYQAKLHEKGHDWWMNWCFELLDSCSEMDVLKIEGWETSEGVQKEIEYAERLNIKINYIESTYHEIHSK